MSTCLCLPSSTRPVGHILPIYLLIAVITNNFKFY